DGGVWRGHQIRDRSGAGVGDRDFVGRGGGVCARGLFECARGHVSGNCDYSWRAHGRGDCGVSAGFGDRHCVWCGAALFGVFVVATEGGSRNGFGIGRSHCRLAAAGWHLSDRGGYGELSCAERAGGIRVDVRGGSPERAAGDRKRRGESAGNGSGDEVAVQGVDDDKQFHDRRDGGGERRDLSDPRIYRPWTGDAGDAGSARGVAGGRSNLDGSEGEGAACGVYTGDSGAWGGDDFQCGDGEIVTIAEVNYTAEKRMDAVMGRLLQVGVTLAAALVL